MSGFQLMADIGKTNRLVITRDSNQGYYLDGENLGEILLPNRYVPVELEQGEEIEVFVYRDSEDRLVASTEKPICEVGEFASLEVLSVNEKIGAFLDWGLPKDLLLPFAEQLGRVRPGQRVVVYVMLDDRSDRIIATEKTNRFLSQTAPEYEAGDAVSLIVMERTPLGYNCLVNGAHRGLLYHSDLKKPLKIGQTEDGFVKKVRGGGQIDLSLSESGFGRVLSLSDQILDALQESGGRLDVGDRSSPEKIYQIFGTSKKAFKKAIGTLYRKKLITLSKDGIELVN